MLCVVFFQFFFYEGRFWEDRDIVVRGSEWLGVDVIYFKSVLRWEPAFAFGFFLSGPRTTIIISIFPKAPFIKEELEENHAHARHLLHTTRGGARSQKTSYHNRASNYPREERVS